MVGKGWAVDDYSGVIENAMLGIRFQSSDKMRDSHGAIGAVEKRVKWSGKMLM